MAVIKVVEIMSDSPASWEEATKQGIATASKTIRNIRSAYVKDQSVTVVGGLVSSYRVTLKVSFEVNS